MQTAMAIRKSSYEDSSVPSNNQLAAAQQALNLLIVPNQISESIQKINFLIERVTAIEEFIVKVTENHDAKDRYMTPEEAMRYLGMSKNTFDKYRYKSRVPIPRYQLGGSNRYKKSDLDRFMLTFKDQMELLAA